MADYWKSQPRKHCDFCKCWIADNKPSRDFHEKGKKHQENVKRKLDELRKKGTADAEKAEEDRRAMQQMEERALAALKKDIMANPSMAAQYGIKLKSKDEGTSEDAAQSSESEDSEPEEKEKTKDDVNAPENWYEAQSAEGYTYYWNTVTQESRWVKPEGYRSPAERLKDTSNNAATSKTPEPANVARKRKTESKDSSRKKTAKSEAVSKSEDSSASTESTKGTAAKRDDDGDKSSAAGVSDTPDGAISQSAYGQWETVQTDPEEPVDLQLPVSKAKAEETTTVVVAPEPKIKFREKKVTSLSDGLFNTGPTGFKKRKLNRGASLRKRVDI